MKAFWINVAVLIMLVFSFSILPERKTTGMVVHETLGLLIVAVVIWHVYIYRSLFTFCKQQTAPIFIYRDIILILLGVLLVFVLVTGILGSKELFRPMVVALQLDVRFWHGLHKDSGDIMLMVIGLHIGMYLDRFLNWFSMILSSVMDGDKARKLLLIGFYLMALEGLIQLGEDLWPVIADLPQDFYGSTLTAYLKLSQEVAIAVFFMMVSLHLTRWLCFKSCKAE